MKYNNRLLGAFEAIMYFLDQYAPTHAVMAAEIQGIADINDWKLALAGLQQRHPLLSVCITGNEHSELRFKHVEDKPIPLRIVRDDEFENLEKELERELSSPFDTSQAPLIRIVLIQKEEQSTLIFARHHSIGDGASLVLVLRDLLNLLNKQVLDPLPTPPSIDDLLGLNDENSNDLPLDASFPAESSNGNQRISRASPVVARMQLPHDFTDKLLKYSRQENTTVYAALSAAIVMASRQIDAGYREKPIRIFTPANIREALSLAGGSSSLCISNKLHAVEPDQLATLWDVARKIKSNVADIKTMEYIIGSTQNFRGLAFGGLTVKDAGGIMNSELDHEFVISNLGVTPYDTTFGPFKLKAIWGPMQFNVSDNEDSVGIATTNNVISITYSSRHPLKDLLPVAKQILFQCCP